MYFTSSPRVSEQFSCCREQRNSPKIGRHLSPAVAFRILDPLHWPPHTAPVPRAPGRSLPLSLKNNIHPLLSLATRQSEKSNSTQSPNGNYSSARAFSWASLCFYVESESPACDAAGNYQVKHVASCSAFATRPLVPHLVCAARKTRKICCRRVQIACCCQTWIAHEHTRNLKASNLRE